MAEITPERNNVTVEEADYRSGVSEGFSFKLGGSVNFINNRQNDNFAWKVLGVAGYLSTFQPITAVDGGCVMLYNAELVGVFLYLKEGGTSGTFEVNIKKSSSQGSQGSSIFSTTPKLSFTAGDYQWLTYDYLSNTTTTLPSGATAPVVSASQFNAGDLVTCDFVQIPPGARDAVVKLFFRPR